jgi:hypothetical protein
MVITFNESEIQLVIESLKCYAADYRRVADGSASGYSSKTRQAQLGKALEAHDLVESIVNEIAAESARNVLRTNRAKSPDPYDNNWPTNDPRFW